MSILHIHTDLLLMMSIPFDQKLNSQKVIWNKLLPTMLSLEKIPQHLSCFCLYFVYFTGRKKKYFELNAASAAACILIYYLQPLSPTSFSFFFGLVFFNSCFLSLFSANETNWVAKTTHTQKIISVFGFQCSGCCTKILSLIRWRWWESESLDNLLEDLACQSEWIIFN